MTALPEERRATNDEFYLGIGIDQRRCAACAAYPTLPCAVHRQPVTTTSEEAQRG